MLSSVEASLSGMSARDGTRSLEIPRPSSEPQHRNTQPSPSTQSARRTGRFQTCPTNQTIHTPIMGVHSSTAPPNPLHRRNPPDVGAGFKPTLPTKHPHPHHGGTLIRHKHSPSPVGRERVGVRARGGEGHTTASPPPHPITAHQRNQRFRLDFHTTSVVQIKTSAQTGTSRTRRPETSPRRTGLGPQLFSMLQLPTYKHGSADGSPHGEPEATAQAER